MAFYDRKRIHDDVAVPFIKERFEKEEYCVESHAQETLNAKFKHFIKNHFDPTSKFIRYQPDLCGVDTKGTGPTVLIEVKTEFSQNQNFSAEADWWSHVLSEVEIGRNIVLIYFDLCYEQTNLVIERSRIVASWAHALPLPKDKTIYIPKRQDWEQSHARLKADPHFSDCLIETRTWYEGSGSGTPFFLWDKDMPQLKSLSDFMQEELRFTCIPAPEEIKSQ